MTEPPLLDRARWETLVRESTRQFRYPPDPQDARALCECLREHGDGDQVVAQGLENCPGGPLGTFASLARQAAVDALKVDFALHPWMHGASDG